MLPKILNRRFALISSLAVLGAVTFAPKASAQNVDVLFDIVIAPSCEFGTPANGTLQVANFTDLTTLTAGTVQLTCTSGDSTLEIAAPVQTLGTTTLVSTALSSEVSSTTIVTPITDTDAATVIGTTGTSFDEELSVSMTFTADAAIPADTYQFSVTLTAAAL